MRNRNVVDQWKTTANVWLVRRPTKDRYRMAPFAVSASQGADVLPIGLTMTPIKTVTDSQWRFPCW